MRKTMFFLTAVLIIACVSVKVWAADTVTVIVDGRKIEFTDAPAYIDEYSRTQVPTRFVGEALGAYVEWDEKARRVTFSRWSEIFDGEYALGDVKVIEFQIGSADYYTRTGWQGSVEKHTMDTKAVIENDRTYIPIRYIAEALNAAVSWNAESKTVTITSESKAVGGFIIPQSYTDSVERFDSKQTGDQCTMFTIDLSDSSYGTNPENRIEHTLYILSQHIGQDGLNKLSKLIEDTYEVKVKRFEPIREVLFDSESGCYICVYRTTYGYAISIFDKGLYPSDEF